MFTSWAEIRGNESSKQHKGNSWNGLARRRPISGTRWEFRAQSGANPGPGQRGHKVVSHDAAMLIRKDYRVHVKRGRVSE